MLPRQHFARLVERDSPAPSLAELGLWIAAEEFAELDVAKSLARFDYLAERVRRLGQRLSVEPAELLRIVLAEEQGFHGNTEQYADPQNSFLNVVLERRAGIPISLSVIYIEVARRAGLQAEGIAFPGHFLTQIGEGENACLIDPFHGGRVISPDECAAILANVAGRRVAVQPEMLQPASWRKIVYRMLANLKNIYLGPPQDTKRALAVIERMLLVRPGEVDDVRDRALLLYQLGLANDRSPLADR